MKRSPFFFTLIAILSLLLVACGDDDDNGDSDSGPPPTPTLLPPTPTPDVSPPPDDLATYDLEPGGHRVSVEGFFNGDDVTFTERERAGAAWGTTNTGFMSNPGTSTVGNAMLELSVWIAPETEPERRLRSAVMFELDPSIGPGSYDLSRRTPVTARWNAATFGFENAEDGTLTIDFVNRAFVTGSFEASFADDDGNTWQTSGAFSLIPFTPGAEYDIRSFGAVNMQKGIGFGSAGMGNQSAYSMNLANDVGGERQRGRVSIVALRDRVATGEFDAADDEAGFHIGLVELLGETGTVTSGTVIITQIEPTVTGTFSFEAETSHGTTTIEGYIQYWDIS